MKILILNWRDTVNPKSGGAEILTHEIAKRWVALGHEVTQFSSSFKNAKDEEIIDGVKVIRRGHPDARYLFFSVQFLAFWYYKKKFKGKFDAVLDEVHGLPFFTPWYVREKKVLLICEVAGTLWTEMFGPIFGSLGKMVEKFYFRFVYRSIPYITISDSTKKELINEGVDSKHVTVLPMGLTVPDNIKLYKKESTPTLIFVGRLSKPKGVEDAIIAVDEISKKIPTIKFWIVGRGDENYSNHLKDLVKKYNLEKQIVFWDFVPDTKKFELISRAHILLSPSIKEGWGLTIPEAAYVATPSIVYDSSGLRDVLRGSDFKIIVKSNTPKELAEEVVQLLDDKALYKKLEKQVISIRKQFDWQKTADVALSVLEKS